MRSSAASQEVAGSRASRPLLAVAAAGLSALLVLATLTPLAFAAGPDGYPWQGTVTASTTTTRVRPDPNAKPIGPLTEGAWLAVLGESGDWYQTPVGFVAKSDLSRNDAEWVGEVAHDVGLLQKPNSKGPMLRNVRAGQLVRVTGVAKGVPLTVGGAPVGGVYWATTIGYLPIDAVHGTANPWAAQWTLPNPDEAVGGWWASVQRGADVRAGPTTDAPTVGQLDGSERIKVLEQVQGKPVNGNATWYRIDGGKFAGAYLHSSLASRIAAPKPNTTAPSGKPAGTWIVVDRSARSLTLVREGQPVFTTYAAIGKSATQTPDGVYSTFYKLSYDTMSSVTTKSDATYYVPNVPSVEYYKDGGYAIHGTYWHDHFGMGTSQGCVNVTETDAAYLFSQTSPQVGSQGEAAAQQGATPVLIVG